MLFPFLNILFLHSIDLTHFFFKLHLNSHFPLRKFLQNGFKSQDLFVNLFPIFVAFCFVLLIGFIQLFFLICIVCSDLMVCDLEVLMELLFGKDLKLFECGIEFKWSDLEDFCFQVVAVLEYFLLIDITHGAWFEF